MCEDAKTRKGAAQCIERELEEKWNSSPSPEKHAGVTIETDEKRRLGSRLGQDRVEREKKEEIE